MAEYGRQRLQQKYQMANVEGMFAPDMGQTAPPTAPSPLVVEGERPIKVAHNDDENQ